MTTYAQRLAAFAAQLQFDAIPSDLIARVKLHVLDILGIRAVPQ